MDAGGAATAGFCALAPCQPKRKTATPAPSITFKTFRSMTEPPDLTVPDVSEFGVCEKREYTVREPRLGTLPPCRWWGYRELSATAAGKPPHPSNSAGGLHVGGAGGTVLGALEINIDNLSAP